MVGETLALLEAVVKATETCPAADEVHRSAVEPAQISQISQSRPDNPVKARL